MENENIFEAAVNNDITTVKQLIEGGHVQPDVKNNEGDTIAHIAAYNVNLALLKYVLEKDAGLLSVRDHMDNTILRIAILVNSLALVKYLVEICATDILQPHCAHHADTYVHFAALTGRLRIFKYFIENRKVHINHKNEWGQPPAFSAARESRLSIIKYIVETCSADVTCIDFRGRNILSHSAVKSDLVVPKYLLDERRLKLDINDTLIIHDSISTADDGIASSKIIKFIEYFVVDKHLDVNGGNEIGQTPLHRAASDGKLNIVKFLVRLGADICREDFTGRTPLEVAESEDVIKYLKGRAKEGNYISERSFTKENPAVGS